MVKTERLSPCEQEADESSIKILPGLHLTFNLEAGSLLPLAIRFVVYWRTGSGTPLVRHPMNNNATLTFQGPRDAREALYFQVHTVPLGRHDSSTVGDGHLSRQGEAVRSPGTVAAGITFGRTVRKDGPRVPGLEHAGQGNYVVCDRF